MSWLPWQSRIVASATLVSASLLGVACGRVASPTSATPVTSTVVPVAPVAVPDVSGMWTGTWISAECKPIGNDWWRAMCSAVQRQSLHHVFRFELTQTGNIVSGTVSLPSTTDGLGTVIVSGTMSPAGDLSLDELRLLNQDNTPFDDGFTQSRDTTWTLHTDGAELTGDVVIAYTGTGARAGSARIIGSIKTAARSSGS